MRFLRHLMLLGALLALTACGFQLRGLSAPLKPLPFASLYLDGKGTVMPEVKKALQRDPRVKLVASAKDAEAMLVITDERTAKDILTINRGGRVNEYQLTLRVTGQLMQNAEPYGEPRVIIVRRRLGYADANVLGKDEEEAMLWSDMRRDAADQLVRSLAYVKPLPPETQQSVKPAKPFSPALPDAQPVR